MPDYQQPRPQYPMAQYQTASEFQQQLARQPSMSAQSSNQQRMLRELGQQQYPGAFNNYHHNTFNQQPYESAPIWQSPKAPTPSPLSDPNVTPNNMLKQGSPLQHNSAWQTLPRMGPDPTIDPASMSNAQSNPYGPMLPQMGGQGNEAWRYT